MYESVVEIEEEILKDEICRIMYDKTYYYNAYSSKMYDTIHYEVHREAHLHHLLDINMLLLNRGINIRSVDDSIILPFIEALLVDTIPVKYGVGNKKEMVLGFAKEYGVKPSFAISIYSALLSILDDNIGLGLLVFTGWLDTISGVGYNIVISEII